MSQGKSDQSRCGAWRMGTAMRSENIGCSHSEIFFRISKQASRHPARLCDAQRTWKIWDGKRSSLPPFWPGMHSGDRSIGIPRTAARIESQLDSLDWCHQDDESGVLNGSTLTVDEYLKHPEAMRGYIGDMKSEMTSFLIAELTYMKLSVFQKPMPSPTQERAGAPGDGWNSINTFRPCGLTQYTYSKRVYDGKTWGSSPVPQW